MSDWVLLVITLICLVGLSSWLILMVDQNGQAHWLSDALLLFCHQLLVAAC